MRFVRRRRDQPVTVLFTDLVGFSSWALRAGDEPAVALLREVTRAVEPALTAHRGRVVKRLGDGVMEVFAEPQQAYDAVLEAKRRLASVDVDGHRPGLRAGLHTGRPRQVRDDLLGVDVNIAARLADKAGSTRCSSPTWRWPDWTRCTSTPVARRRFS